jgi:hypothetical protein
MSTNATIASILAAILAGTALAACGSPAHHTAAATSSSAPSPSSTSLAADRNVCQAFSGWQPGSGNAVLASSLRPGVTLKLTRDINAVLYGDNSTLNKAELNQIHVMEDCAIVNAGRTP